jgi:long-chain acyl-CoA synthetase
VLEGFGLTESSAATCVNPPSKAKIGTVGPPLPGTLVKIASDGELLIRGPGVMRGYYQDPIATAEVLDQEGWLHSGDIAEIDPEGYVRITDRKKDLIVTAGGKNVAPQNLENLLKSFPLVSQAMVYGDRRKYLVALICINEEVARRGLAEQGLSAPVYAELTAMAEVKAAVQKLIDLVNAQQPPHHTLKRFALIDHEFTQESGELTPTLKVKRKFCTQKYQGMLDCLYDGAIID